MKQSIKTNLGKILLFATVAITLTSCEKEQIERTMNYDNPSSKSTLGEGAIVLGNKLNDPYDVDFINEAFSQLVDAGIEFPFNRIEPTGQYVRLFAGSTEELDLIESDTNTLWFDFPLDYEMSEGGTYYHDPSLPDSATWKYAVLPMNYSFPSNIQKELLHYVFIPDDHPDYDKYEDAFDLLEELSEKLCGNRSSSEEDSARINNTRGRKWAPSATIRTWDNVVHRLIPLQGAKVTARHYTKCRSGITNSQGKYTFESEFKKGHRVKYGITWERAYWDIRNALGIQQYYNGPKVEQAWNLDIYGQKSLMFATMHRALLKAFYGYWGGINRPYASHKLKVGYLDSYGGKNLAWNICTWNMFGLLNNISVHGRDSNNNFLTCSDLFGNLTHELGHQSMLRYVGGTWNFAGFSYTNFIRESYANCVEWYITNHYYRNDLGVTNYSHRYDYQWWENKGEESSYYTPVFIDLIDEYNQIQEGNGYNENVSGYTLYEIQDLLIDHSYGAHSLRVTLKNNLLHGVTTESIDELIDNYIGTGF